MLAVRTARTLSLQGQRERSGWHARMLPMLPGPPAILSPYSVRECHSHVLQIDKIGQAIGKGTPQTAERNVSASTYQVRLVQWFGKQDGARYTPVILFHSA